MKKIVFISGIVGLLIFNFTPANAQRKCKFDVNKTDPMTGMANKSINTLIKVMGMFSPVVAWGIEFDKKGDDFSIVSRLVIKQNSTENLEKGDSLMVKLASGKIITVYSNNTVKPRELSENSNDKYNSSTNYVSSYSISPEEFKLLTSEKILLFRINVGPLVFDQEVKDKISSKLQIAGGCIFQ